MEHLAERSVPLWPWPSRGVGIPFKPRRSREVTHLCSDRVIHAKNRPCPLARDETGDFIRAEGAQGLCIPPTSRSPGSPGCPGRALPCAKWSFWWVSFREQTWVTSHERRSFETPISIGSSVIQRHSPERVTRSAFHRNPAKAGGRSDSCAEPHCASP